MYMPARLRRDFSYNKTIHKTINSVIRSVLYLPREHDAVTAFVSRDPKRVFLLGSEKHHGYPAQMEGARPIVCSRVLEMERSFPEATAILSRHAAAPSHICRSWFLSFLFSSTSPASQPHSIPFHPVSRTTLESWLESFTSFVSLLSCIPGSGHWV